jgi:SanA protein
MPFPALTHLKRIPKRTWFMGLSLLVLGDLLWTLGRFPRMHRQQMHDENTLPQTDAAVLILGAGVYSDGEPTQVLEGRLKTALALYRAGKVRWFLVSGDNRTLNYNEPLAMRRWLLKQGVPRTLIVGDYAGRRTYDSVKRAKEVFGLRRCVIVTSDFHLPRALYLAQAVGLDAWGVPASTESSPRDLRVSFWLREYVARHRARLDASFPPKDTLLGPREATPSDWAPKESTK